VLFPDTKKRPFLKIYPKKPLLRIIYHRLPKKAKEKVLFSEKFLIFSYITTLRMYTLPLFIFGGRRWRRGFRRLNRRRWRRGRSRTGGPGSGTLLLFRICAYKFRAIKVRRHMRPPRNIRSAAYIITMFGSK
jgi:hypothetical protein